VLNCYHLRERGGEFRSQIRGEIQRQTAVKTEKIWSENLPWWL